MKFVILVLALTISACATDGMDDTQSASKSAGSAKACEACTNDRDCADGLACHQGVWVCKSPKRFDDSVSTPGKPKVPQCKADCLTSEGCWGQGKCHLAAGECWAKSESDCLQTANCKSVGSGCKFRSVPHKPGYGVCD